MQDNEEQPVRSAARTVVFEATYTGSSPVPAAKSLMYKNSSLFQLARKTRSERVNTGSNPVGAAKSLGMKTKWKSHCPVTAE